MSKPYRFIPLDRTMQWVEREPTRYMFTVHFRYMSSFNPVTTEPIYISSSYRDAMDFLEATTSYLPNKKTRQVFVKQVGYRHKHFSYDPRFEEALNEMTDADSDEYYEEKTDDDLVSVQIHQPDKVHKVVRAVWRGAVRRSEPNHNDSVLDTWEGGLG